MFFLQFNLQSISSFTSLLKVLFTSPVLAALVAGLFGLGVIAIYRKQEQFKSLVSFYITDGLFCFSDYISELRDDFFHLKAELNFKFPEQVLQILDDVKFYKKGGSSLIKIAALVEDKELAVKLSQNIRNFIFKAEDVSTRLKYLTSKRMATKNPNEYGDALTKYCDELQSKIIQLDDMIYTISVLAKALLKQKDFSNTGTDVQNLLKDLSDKLDAYTNTK